MELEQVRRLRRSGTTEGVSFWDNVLTPRDRNWRRALVGALLPIADILILAVTTLLCELLYDTVVRPAPATIRTDLLVSFVGIVFVLLSAQAGSYDVTRTVTRGDCIRRTVSTWALAFLLVLAAAFLTKTAELFSRGVTLLVLVFGCVGISFGRILLRRMLERRDIVHKVMLRRVLVVHFGDASMRLDGEDGFRTVAELKMRALPGARAEAIDQVREDLRLIVSTARLLRPDDILVDMPSSDGELCTLALETLMTLPAAIHLRLPAETGRLLVYARTTLGPYGSITLVRPSLSFLGSLTKRLFDMAVSATALFLLAPVFIAVAIAIRTDGPGPAIFRQRRYGLNLTPFLIYKFRTMSVQEEGAHVAQATRDDPRVTPIGRWLRRWNIDELPQFWNVLKGDMSIIGPRPHAMAHDQAHQAILDGYGRRHNVKPGISGWAQVNGARGEILSPEDIRQRMDHDLFYIANWSLWLDIKILYLTVFSRKAYANAQ